MTTARVKVTGNLEAISVVDLPEGNYLGQENL